MKTIPLKALTLLFATVVASAFTLPEKEAVTYNIDTQKSEVSWKGEKVTGEHIGTINLQEGTLMLEDGTLVGGSFTIDMNTITTTDLEGEDKGKLEGHLKSDDFFGVQSYPTAKLNITNVEAKGNNKYEITGDLTIKETTQEVTFPATVTTQENQVTADASITINRSKYDVRYGSGSFFDDLGDKTIYDEFHLQVSLVAQNSVGN